MTWAKLDDRFHEHRKVQRALRVEPASIALHVMAITYCAGHETDGFVDDEFVGRQPLKMTVRQRATGALEQAGMWERVAEGWMIHDYLDFHPSREELTARRVKDSERKARGRDTLSARTPRGIHSESARPDPTRPVPLRSVSGGMGLSAGARPPEEKENFS